MAARPPSVTSQVPVEHWHDVISDPTLADAILDRLIHNAHRLVLKGESMRKITAQRDRLDVAAASWPHQSADDATPGRLRLEQVADFSGISNQADRRRH